MAGPSPPGRGSRGVRAGAGGRAERRRHALHDPGIATLQLQLWLPTAAAACPSRPRCSCLQLQRHALHDAGSCLQLQQRLPTGGGSCKPCDSPHTRPPSRLRSCLWHSRSARLPPATTVLAAAAVPPPRPPPARRQQHTNEALSLTAAAGRVLRPRRPASTAGRWPHRTSCSARPPQVLTAAMITIEIPTGAVS